jgi:penicillin amidase
MRNLRSPFLITASFAAPLALAGCVTTNPPGPDAALDAPSIDARPFTSENPPIPQDAPDAVCFGDMTTTETLAIPGLDGALEVVYDDRGVPHIYGTTIHDVVMAQAYLMARDRYGQMDFIRRNVLGRLAEVAGGLDTSLADRDFDNRVMGYQRMGRAIYASLPATSRSRIAAEAFAAGVNAYIAAVDAGTESPYVDGGDLIALLTAASVDRVWRPEDVFAMARFQAASLSYDAGADTSRSAILAAARATFTGANPRAGIFGDIFDDTPARDEFTRDIGPGGAAGFNDGSTTALRRPREHVARPTDPTVLAPLSTLRGAQSYFNRIESSFEMLGFGDESRGSNNWLVAAEHTANGNPIMSNDPHLSLISPAVWWYCHLNTARMGGEGNMDVEGVAFAGLPGVILGFNQEIAWGATTTGYDVTDVYMEQITAGVGGAPDTVAFDTDGNGTLEQVPLRTEQEMIGVMGMGTPMMREIQYVTTHGPAGTLSPIVPGSRQPVAGMPGRFTALSVRYTGFEVSDELAFFGGLWTSRNVRDAEMAQNNFRVGGQNFIVADRNSIRWSSEVRIPVRDDRATNMVINPDGTVTGECPIFVLPGQGQHEWRSDLSDTVIPHDENPARGWIATANQDNVGVTLDGNPCNDAHYIGGDFDLGWRQDRIERDLRELVTRGDITAEDMMRTQAESRSALAETLRDPFVAVLAAANTHVPGLTAAELADIEIARTRLAAWTSRETPEGTTATDMAVINDSVATSIWNAIITRVAPLALQDEATAMGFGSIGGTRTSRFIERSFSTAEAARFAIYWDNLTTTPAVETKEQAVVRATIAGMAFLRTTLGADVTMWRWGRLHTVRFDSVLPTVGTDILSIPRQGDATYPNGFPRHGDFGAVDPGNFGMWNTTNFSFGSGASQRLVVEMTETGPLAWNALPGGQSIDPNSPHKQDEALLWIRNEARRLAFQEAEVRAAAARCLRIRP